MPPLPPDVGARQINLPLFLRSVEGTTALAEELAEVLTAIGAEAPLLISGPTQSASICEQLDVSEAERTTVSENTRSEVTRIAAGAKSTVRDALIAVGGGRPIDVAKAAALLVDLPVIVIPTQLSADGIASPIAVIAEGSGETVSERSALPVAVLADTAAICAAPIEFARAGVGDLLSNRTALVDWRLAAEAGAEEIDDFAALLATGAHLLIEGLDLSPLARGELTRDLAQRLLDGLVLSGLAMTVAGSSRPCSGAEHLISHALDELEPGTAPHGEQVAFGTLLATALQGGDPAATAARLEQAGLTKALKGFGLAPQRLAEIVEHAPQTRPGRYTVLDERGPGRAQLTALIAELIA
jgi:glycerol-1-phosphate dehydrogenase [NAD(P)+]